MSAGFWIGLTGGSLLALVIGWIAFGPPPSVREAVTTERARAIEAGVGRYEVDPATGAVEFVYGVAMKEESK